MSCCPFIEDKRTVNRHIVRARTRTRAREASRGPARLGARPGRTLRPVTTGSKIVRKKSGCNLPVPVKGTRIPGSGRKKGTPNKVTEEFRVTIQRLLDENRENILKWVAQVAEGLPDKVNAKGQVVQAGRPPDPGMALARLGALADYAAPKLSRQEQVGEGGGPLTVVIRKEA